MFSKCTFLLLLAFNFLPFYSQALSQNHHLSSNSHLPESLVFDSKTQDNENNFKVQESELEDVENTSSIYHMMETPIAKENSTMRPQSLRPHNRILQDADGDDAMSDGIDDNDDDDVDDDDVDTQDDTGDGDAPDDIDNTDDNEEASGGTSVQNSGPNNQNTGDNNEEDELNQEESVTQTNKNQVPDEEILLEEEPEELVETAPIEGSVEMNSDEEDPVEGVEEENNSNEANQEETDGEETQEAVEREEESDEEDAGEKTEEVIIRGENLEEEDRDQDSDDGGGAPIEEENFEEDVEDSSENSDEEGFIGAGGLGIEESGDEDLETDDDTDNLETSPIEEEEELLLVPSEYDDCSSPNNYHYPNGTCGSSCPSGKFIIQQNSQENYKTCAPCSSNCKTCQNTTETCTSCPFNVPYLNENSTCLVSCPSGTTIQESPQGQKLCVTAQLTPRQQNFVNFVDNSYAVTSTISSVTMVSYQIVNPGASAIPSVILLVNLLDYVKYLNISFPPKLDAMFSSKLTDYLSFQIPFDFPESLQDEIHEQNVPWRFQRYEVNGLFLVNMWGETLTAILVFAVACVIALISFKISNEKWFGKIIFWLQDFLIWNYVLVYWLSILNNIVLFAIIEYQNLYLNGALAIISLILNIIFLTSSFLFLGFIYYKLRQLRVHKYETQKEKATSHSKIKVLFEDFKSFYFTQELMIVISSVKVILYAIIIAAFDAPVAQIILLILIDVSMVFYLIVFRPLRENWQNIELIIYQILALIANCACLKLAMLSPEDQVRDIRTGDVIIITNFILISAVFLFQVVSRGIQLKGYCKGRKAQKKISQQVHPNKAPAPGPARSPISTASSTPKGGSEDELDQGETGAKLGLRKEEITELDLRLQLRMDSRRSSIRSLRSLRSVSTVVSLSDHTRTIIIRSSSNKSEENQGVKEKSEDEKKP